MVIRPIIRVFLILTMIWILSEQAAFAHPGHELESPDLFFGAVEMTPQLFVTGVGIAFGFGAIHALAPGHGKTMVAAYLVGNRGTAKHALLLGMITTISHTLSVMGLAVLALAASQYIVPAQLYPVLSSLSGLMVLGVGLWLFRQSWLSRGSLNLQLIHPSPTQGDLSMQIDQLPAENKLRHDHEHNHNLDHAHDHPYNAASALGKTALLPERPFTHSKDPDLHPSSCNCGHAHEIPEDLSLKSLVTLGIAGGMVPCPSALVLLLSAIAFHQVIYGLFLVSAFSFGMASVLIALGFIVVYAKHWFEELPSKSSWFGYLPMASASVIILTGIVLTGYAILPNAVF